MSNQAFFILAGGYDTKNVGDYAMLLPLRRILSDRGYCLKLLSRHPQKHLMDLYGVAEILENYEYETREKSEGKFFRGLNFGDDTTHLRGLATEISASEGLIIGGGRLLIDYTLDVMRGPLPYFGLLVTLCKFLGKPVYIYGMTIIENQSVVGNQLLRYIVDNCSKVCVRDAASGAVLESIGCAFHTPEVIPDPAFCLSWKHDDSISDTSDLKLVGLTVRPISGRWGGMSFDDYIAHMAETVSAIQESTLGLKAQGIPHQFYGVDDLEYDDRYILEQIHQRTPFQAGYIQDEMLDLEEYRKIYSRLGTLVGIRRHSFVFAALANTPILPMSENPNASRMCEQLRTIPPLPLDYSMTEFRQTLAEIFARRKEICAKQNSAAMGLSADLLETYARWLFE
jgi:polysaccharide pyruvyl transferase WcaK-like protein